MRLEKDVKHIQCWPSGHAFDYTGDIHGPSKQRRLRGGKSLRWRTGTAKEWREILINVLALIYQERDVLACQSSLVTELMEKQIDGFTIEDVRNIYPNTDNMDAAECREYCEDRGIDAPERPTIECDACKGNGENVNDPIGTKCKTCKGDGEISDPDADEDDGYLTELRDAVRDNAEPAEVFEWWLVTGWLCGKLDAVGEVTIDNDYGYWWGRCTTGQQYIMDGVLQRVAAQFVREDEPTETRPAMTHTCKHCGQAIRRGRSAVVKGLRWLDTTRAYVCPDNPARIGAGHEPKEGE